jgi:Xaa-Pro aminopeptidase
MRLCLELNLTCADQIIMKQTIKDFESRRLRLLECMQDGVAVIPTSSEVIRNRDTHYPYRFDSYFYYLTGFKEPDSVLFLIAGEENKTILFCRDKNPEREIWDGFRYGPQGAMEAFGFDEAYSIERLDELAPKLLANQKKLYFSLGRDAAFDLKINRWLNQLRSESRQGILVPTQLVDIQTILDEMRLIKSPVELDLMRHSAMIAADAHLRAMQYVKPGMTEYEIEAEILHEFYRRGAQSVAYQSIVASGSNACVLHYIENRDLLNDGDLLLIDAGCELDGYASDITRTFPINRKFSGPQKALYEIVLSAQQAAIECISPGQPWNAFHDAAVSVLAQGFIDLGLCNGSVDAVIESGSYRQYYMHRTGHWLGLDVHDVGAYKEEDGGWRNLEAGMVLTVEPGCYIRPSDSVPEEFWNIGIRIEDDAIVTHDGCEIITHGVPKSVQEIEALMRDD